MEGTRSPMNEPQREVRAFVDEYDPRCDPAFRVLDLASEVGEIATDVTESTEYGRSSDRAEVEADEIGDALLSLLALADSLDIDADDALDESLAKYRARLDETGSASSGIRS